MMSCLSRSADRQRNDIGMSFGWHLNVNTKLNNKTQTCNDTAGDMDMHDILMSPGEASHFADAIASLAHLKPHAHTFDLQDTMDPTKLWPASMDDPNMHSCLPPVSSPDQPLNRTAVGQAPNGSCPLGHASQPREASGPSITRDSLSAVSTPSMIVEDQPLPAQASTPASMNSDSAIPAPPAESEKTRRARYAANQRHGKARESRRDSALSQSPSEADTCAEQRKQRHREKNKAAAAKCRLRQRKQVQTIQDKCARLEQKNSELKVMVQQLRGELNGLRSRALAHQHCNCHVTQYNIYQTERVVAEYRSTCLGQESGGVGGQFPTQQSIAVQ